MTETVLSHLYRHADERADHPAYGERAGDRWRMTTWRTYAEQVTASGKALLSLGLESRERVAILSNNRAQWATTCLATMAAGGVPVGIYQTCSADQVAYILEHAEAPIVVVENAQQWRKVAAVRDRLPRVRHVVVMQGDVPASQAPEAAASAFDIAGAQSRDLVWDAFIALGTAVDERRLTARTESIRSSDLATFIYTSGTTGRPKAVMLSHGNLLETGRIGEQLHRLVPEDRLVSYLPMAHIAEQMLSVHMPAFVGFTIYYVDAPEKLLGYLQEVQPTIFFGVPRVWEKFESGIRRKLDGASAPMRGLLSWAGAIARRHGEFVDRGETAGGWLRLRWRLADRLLATLRQRIGLGSARIASSGAAPIGRDILDFFAGLGVRIYEVYGLSETCGPGTWNSVGKARLGTVGPVLPGVEIRLGDDGEVLFRGPNIFQGYFKDPEGSAEVLEPDGWFHTGDLGSLDAQGYLTITGRKKEIIITSGGKNIAPSGIEAKLKNIPGVGDAVVVGDGRRFLTALLTFDDEVQGLSPRHPGGDPDEPLRSDSPVVVAAIRRGVDDVNSQLARVETIRNFRVLERRFSIDEGELTPTLKVKRRVVHERYAEHIEAMYNEGQKPLA